jgi:hypothetical protein
MRNLLQVTFAPTIVEVYNLNHPDQTVDSLWKKKSLGGVVGGEATHHTPSPTLFVQEAEQ